ncbi:E3 binding domain-containing protein [Streptomyces luteogriseus]|uniref:E3 binding domain-containing protein n=1 Tax=Streptomyces luteogriseus TaxID=68233 RepID=UPI00378E7822
MSEFTMPSLGADMDEGTLLEWLVGPGDTVHKGDPVAVVETAKSTIEVECFESGTMTELLVEPGTTVPVGTPLALIGPKAEKSGKREEPGKSAKSGKSEGPREAGQAEERRPVRHTPKRGAVPERPSPPPEPAPAPVPSAVRPSGHIEAGPLVRHLAEHSGVDLETLHGSGPGGRVTRTDVERATAARAGTGAPRVRATPRARRLAAELGVDLATVTGTGRGSAVRAADVRQAAPGPSAPAPSPPVGAAPLRPSAERPSVERPAENRTVAMRQAIAGLMTRANRDIPHYYLSTTVDMAAAMAWLHEHNRRSPVGERLLPAALLLKAAALAATEVPEFNGFWTDDHFTAGEGVHLGVAVSLRGAQGSSPPRCTTPTPWRSRS